MASEAVLLCALAFFAGLVDAIAGGGGLIQVPALFALLPGAAPAALLGTNKLVAIAGTAVASARYARAVPGQWRALRTVALMALAGGAMGAGLASYAPESILRVAILVLLITAFVQTLTKPRFGLEARPRVGSRQAEHMCAGALGLYDGFAGPGTGSLFMYAYARWFGRDFLGAAATAKLLNLGTNAGALGVFVGLGNVEYGIAVPMLLANLAGGYAGASLALRHGTGFIRRVFVGVVVILMAKLAWDLIVG